MKMIECVPNFSEGRNRQVIDKITQAIEAAGGVTVLDVDPGADTNRTVVTFVGEPECVIEAAFAGIKKASEVIDMRHHQGAHARMGATDVCPFVPVSDVTMKECVAYSRTLAKRVGLELGIPVFLYEFSAQEEKRRNLATVRAGEFEGMAEKLSKPEWKPDFGPSAPHETAGVTAIGARKFLIAYNVNLSTRSKQIAHEIALRIREQGRKKRDARGKFVRDDAGKIVLDPGKLKACKAVGWYIDEYQQAQVSINLTDFEETPPHVAFEQVREEARDLGVRVTGSELVGLIPKQALLMAGRHYLRAQDGSLGIPEKDVLDLAIKSLGLDDLTAFDAREKIIEFRVGEPFGPLANMKLHEFADETSTDSPAPGGGSVSAFAGALAASLASMVANLTLGKKKWADRADEMNAIGEACQKLKDRLLQLIDEDTDAFNQVMAAMRLPKKTESQKSQRESAIEAANQHATEIPLNVLRACAQIMPHALAVVRKGNPNSASDAGVAGEMAHAGARGAAMNVRINLLGIQDEAFGQRMRQEAHKLLSEVDATLTEIRAEMEQKLTP